MRVVVANRGEVAVRILRTARECGYSTLVLHTVEESASLAVRLAQDTVELPGGGAAAYLDIAAVVAAARKAGAGSLVHPGYGFLSESADFAQACASAGLVFVGPDPRVLRSFGDKVAARAAADAAGVAVIPATTAEGGQAAVAALLAAHPGGVMIKAAAGGGGRGMRAVHDPAGVSEAYARCRAEARAGFGDDAVYAEALVTHARHIEVQIVADGRRAAAVGDRDCSVQRRRQKLLEVAPAPNLPAALRERLHRDAVAIVESVGCRGVVTVEFLVRGEQAWFLEVNPRLQVEHTVTEEVSGVDLVAVQFRLALGDALEELSLPAAEPHGYAVQARVNAELVGAGGELLPSTGILTQFGAPTGAGVRVDTAACPGMRQSARFDSLLAKVIARGASYPAALQRCSDALAETVIGGVDTNAALLRAVLDELPRAESVDTSWFERNVGELLTHAEEFAPMTALGQDGVPAAVGVAPTSREHAQPPDSRTTAPDADPLAREADSSAREADPSAPAGQGRTADEHAAGAWASAAGDRGRGPNKQVPDQETQTLLPDEQPLRTPMGAVVVSLAEPGTVLPPGAEAAVLEAMKMQHVLRAETALRVARQLVAPGDVVDPHDILLTWAEAEHDGESAEVAAVDLDAERADLAEVRARHATTEDAARGEAVAKRRRLGRRTARENIADVVDDGSFVEYGALMIAAQRGRRDAADLIANTPADGLVAGVATINADRFGGERARAVVMSYDYTVLAGTQGVRNHDKTDRMLHLAHEQRLPVVFFTEGGGGRPGDTDHGGISMLDVTTFRAMGALSGRVPLIGVVSGRCFAGNAALLGMCDVVIATPDANIGMGGPAMIEGGGLGVYAPEDIGPIEVQRRNGVVHLVAADEAEAVDLARRYLAYFQGAQHEWEAPDPRLARHVVPENRLRAFDIRAAIEAVADVGSVLEVRRDWGVGAVTALVRVEGRPFGLIANDCHHLGGAIDAPAADKLGAFLRLCQLHGLPIVSLCDTPGFMVGPEAEKEATVTRFSRLFIDAAALTVPFGTVIVRKGYGLGAQAMAAGSFRAPRFVIAWPTGEIGGMGLEGAVRLGFAKELAAIEDPVEREAAFNNLVGLAYENGKALTAATVGELDDVIDPADTRRWIATLR
ncbi:acetyl/propionyl-CoA carboxylase alpha subunit [Nocardia sp. GAS34]|uniref:acetyl-CoA carboxylase family protein n=1 Tax=unclassified Nocardia TaxID=2637762 RepID=UPI003D24601D